MSREPNKSAAVTCPECGTDNVQSWIDLRTEGESPFSTQPYRIVRCHECRRIYEERVQA